MFRMYEGGYSHAPDDLSYGVDMKKIRWCGILQVQYLNLLKENKKLFRVYVLFISSEFISSVLTMQRIALVYFVVALIEAFTTKVRPTTVRSGPYAIFHAYRWQWYTNITLIFG